MSKKVKDDFNWFQNLTLSFFDKIYGHFDDEDAEARLNKSRGIKVFNINWIIIALVLIAIYIVSRFSTDIKKNVCLYNAERSYHQEERKACEKFGLSLGCDLYQMDTQAWGQINARHDSNVGSCKN